MKENIELAEAVTKITCTLLVIITFCWMLISLTYKVVPLENSNTVNLMLGTLGGLVLAIIGYYYGSSEGSKRNREQLNKMAEAATPVGGAIVQTTETTIKKNADPPAKP